MSVNDRMTQLTENFSKLPEISDRDTKKSAIEEIKAKLETLPTDQLKEIAQNVNYNLVLPELASDDRELIDPLCDILRKLFDTLEGGEVYSKYREALITALRVNEVPVKMLTLRELTRTIQDPIALSILCKDSYVLDLILKNVADEDLTIVQMSGVILKKIGEDASGLKILCKQFHKDLTELISKNSTVGFRVLEIIVDISVHSKEGLQACEEAGFLNNLILLLSDNEILVQLNALELVTKLALHPEGLNYLERNDVLQELAEKIVQANEDPLSSLLIPGLIKFFGNVAQNTPNEIFSNYPGVITALFEVIEAENLQILPIALDTLGHISVRVEGKYALDDLGDAMPRVLKKLADVLRRLPSEIKIRALNNLGLILKVEEFEQDNRILSLTKSWFDLLGDDPLDLIVSFCKQPFADIRGAGLEVLGIIALQMWGQEYIANAPGLIEFLLDRSIESFKECKEAKFEVVRTLSRTTADIFDANTIQRFKQFVTEGPMYVETITDVATEGAL